MRLPLRWLPVPLLLLAVIYLNMAESSQTYPSTALVRALYFAFSTLTSATHRLSDCAELSLSGFPWLAADWLWNRHLGQRRVACRVAGYQPGCHFL